MDGVFVCSVCRSAMLLFFFFQAEDGIRDGRVTGVQTCALPIWAMLERLGRVHSRGMVFKSFDVLRKAGFENVNLDLMFAIPGQTMDIWSRTLNEAIALGSEHLSCYEVIYEEDTPLYAQLRAGQFAVDEDLACGMYEELIGRAGQADFRQYEIANFARETTPNLQPSRLNPPGRACRHNINY